jgi:hypothetical protein
MRIIKNRRGEMKLIDTAMKLIATIAICAMICGIWTYTPEWAETNEANSGVPDQEKPAPLDCHAINEKK